MKIKFACLVLAIYAHSAAAAVSEQDFKSFWKPIDQLEYSQVTFDFIVNGGDYVNSESIDFRQKERSFQVCTIEYKRRPAPIEVQQQTTFIHPLTEIEARENLNNLYFKILKSDFQNEEMLCGVTITVKLNNAKEESMSLSLSPDIYKQLIELRRKWVQDYFLFPQKK